ncbi:MAG TPA: AMP-binding protein [Candidatus Stackebrandtia excrementipullorum]|nr:AMP-binding protein [Candidatus Stackebrandtia excrementipullorum]
MTSATTVVTTVLTAPDSFTARHAAVRLLEDTPTLRSRVERVAEAGDPILFTVVSDAADPSMDNTACGTVFWSESRTADEVVGVLGVVVDVGTAAAISHSSDRWTSRDPGGPNQDASPARLGTKAPGEDWDVTDLLRGPDDVVAVQDGRESLRYGELRAAAEAVAAGIVDSGPTGRILIRGRRDVRTVVAMLGCWLASTAWCAVDITAPRARRDAIESDVRPDLVLDSADVELRGTPNSPAVRKPSRIPADAVGYLVATSGSTGRPKVSALPAGGLRPLLRAWRREYAFTSPQRVCQIGSLEGDVFIGDMLKALDTAGTLHIVPDEQRADPEAVADLVDRYTCTFIESTPVLVTAVLRELARGDLHRPTVTVVGSDVFRANEARHLVELAAGRTRVVNGYGTTECMIESLVYDCTELPTDHEGLCPIGRPLDGTAVTVRRPDHTVAAVGEVGALHLAAPGATLGYLTAGKLTPVGPELDTGDRAAVDPSGFVAFHGRADAMVKVRGYRVEPAEVEDALLTVAGIGEAHVTSFRRAGATELVAFVSGSNDIDAATVRSALRGILTEGAIPARIQVMARLPRLETGKLDRLALAREAERYERDPLAPRPSRTESDVEGPAGLRQTVARCWEAVLGGPADPSIGFFDQGGTSVLLIALAEELRTALGANHPVAVADLFRYPSIDTYIGMIERRRSTRSVPPPSEPKPADLDRRGILEAVAAGRMSVAEARRLMAS